MPMTHDSPAQQPDAASPTQQPADTPRPIILDCDPGHDDAIAIILALGHPGIDLRGITTVVGNQTLEKVTRNAQSVLTLCRQDQVPVHAGAAQPLIRPVRVAADIHGDSGLDGVDLPEPTRPVGAEHAVQFIIDQVLDAEPGTLTLVATGPLTNLALAARLEPRIVDMVREVVLMGGGAQRGNRTPVAEFNIWADPEAAHIVFDAPWPVTMVGLDLTHQALATADVRARIAGIASPLSELVGGVLEFYRGAYVRAQHFTDPPVHDPCTIAYLIDPHIVQTRRAPVQVELNGAHTTGMTVVDLRTAAGPDCHTQVATHLDHGRFWDLVVGAIRALG